MCASSVALRAAVVAACVSASCGGDPVAPPAPEPTPREKLEDLEELELVPRDDATPLPEWAQALEAKCQAGEIERCVDLASALHDGYDVPQDWSRAGALLIEACGNKSERGCDLLAALAGKDTKTDAATVSAVLSKACDQGVATACEAAKPR